MKNKKIKILGFAGSLRKDSYNRALIRATKKLLPKSTEMQTFDLSDIPLFNADVESEKVPESVESFRKAILDSDALIIASPEHNGTISAVLKNALEWASRHNDHYDTNQNDASPLNDKPVAIMGAST